MFSDALCLSSAKIIYKLHNNFLQELSRVVDNQFSFAIDVD